MIDIYEDDNKIYYEFTLRFSGISENDFKKLVYHLESSLDDYFFDNNIKEI